MASVTTRRLLAIVLVATVSYVASYAAFRVSHVERWTVDDRDYVIVPADARWLYYLYRPVMYLDEAATGMRFHIGPHR